MASLSIRSQGNDATFLGHPRGLAYLAFTEAWERFSFYGMQSLLVLYMVQSLFMPGQIENVAGMAAYRSAVETVLGPLSAQALAGQTFGFYAVADRWLGAKKTVVIGVVLMTAGHAAMVFDQSFLLALLLLILGSGALKGNIAAQVGQLYAMHDARRTTAFAAFSMAINIGAIFGPLACGLLAQAYGWHYGFGVAGLLMLVALGVYLKGLRYFPEEPPVRRDRSQEAALTMQEWRSIAAIMVMLLMMVVLGLGYDQMYNMGMVWIDQAVDLDTALGRLPVAWFVSIDSVAIVAATAGVIALWQWQANHGRSSSESTKIAIGGALTTIGVAIIAVGAAMAESGKVSIAFPVLAFAFTGIGFAWYWATWLALVSRYSPAKIAARMMAAAYLVAFFGNVISGYIATFYEAMSPALFWSLNAGVCFAGSAAFYVFGPMLVRGLHRGAAERPFARQGVDPLKAF
ncbi:MAG: MFS transporter [Alphaproteobacteria bacterium HGW-Alphaproteobacteria-14]|nr:MAG: MFS transporter [Alphaproteobacteria bacterium HGW-Alphaproteobacteria-14]